MFQVMSHRSGLRTTLRMLTLIFHWTARSLTTSHRSPVMAVIVEIIQTVVMVAVFFGMFSILGMRSSAIRGDFLLYIMSGVFCFITHTKAVGVIMGADGPLSPMMLHAPMNTTIAITSAALGMLYKQIVTVTVLLFVYDAYTENITFYRLLPAAGMFIVAWASGCAIGLVFLALKPHFPRLAPILAMTYRRSNMLFSGKMFLANSLPGYMLPMFAWNPLFHIIDQCRGFTFINYNPHFTSIGYPVKLSLALLVLGMMAEFSSRKNASLSAAKR